MLGGIGLMCAALVLNCARAGNAAAQGADDTAAVYAASSVKELPVFERDSAYSNVARQVAFGPRVPNTAAHEACAGWLASELARHGAAVTLQKADLPAWDGTILKTTNIMGSFNPEMGDRLLLLAHYDTRPWADKDSDPAKRQKPIDGANDGASGVGVLLEAARLLGTVNPGKGVDILFIDSEDYGTEADDDSWALGAAYFAENPILPGYRPARAVLLDMVGGKNARFASEYFSRRSARALDDAFRGAAAREGYAEMFPSTVGGAVNDDHIPFLRNGIPAIDIIDYQESTGFPETWHTADDNLDNIDPATLEAVGKTLIRFIYE